MNTALILVGPHWAMKSCVHVKQTRAAAGSQVQNVLNVKRLKTRHEERDEEERKQVRKMGPSEIWNVECAVWSCSGECNTVLLHQKTALRSRSYLCSSVSIKLPRTPRTFFTEYDDVRHCCFSSRCVCTTLLGRENVMKSTIIHHSSASASNLLHVLLFCR